MSRLAWHDITRVIIKKRQIILVLAKNRKTRKKANRFRSGHYKRGDLTSTLTPEDWKVIDSVKLPWKARLIRDIFHERDNRPCPDKEFAELFRTKGGDIGIWLASYISPLFNTGMRAAKKPYRVLVDPTKRYEGPDKAYRIYKLK